MTSKSFRNIGFVDDCLDNFHANTYLALLRGALLDRGYRVAGAVGRDTAAAQAWCSKNNVTCYRSVSELAEHVDCFMILAPSASELHLPMAEQVMPFGKPVFVDKTFAPNERTARQIFALADRYSTPIHTTSALRTTNVQSHVRSMSEPVRNLYVWAGGTSLQEYGIHPVELVVSCLGPRVLNVMRIGSPWHFNLLIRFEGERNAVIDFNARDHVDYLAAISTDHSTEFMTVGMETLFRDAMASILDFFDEGGEIIDRAETLAIHQILESAEAISCEDSESPTIRIPSPHFRGAAEKEGVIQSKADEVKS